MDILPDFSLAIINDAKLEGYLFDPNHGEGWPKGKFLLQAGFEPSDPTSVWMALILQASSAEILTRTTNYGIKSEDDGFMISPEYGDMMRIKSKRK